MALQGFAPSRGALNSRLRWLRAPDLNLRSVAIAPHAEHREPTTAQWHASAHRAEILVRNAQHRSRFLYFMKLARHACDKPSDFPPSHASVVLPRQHVVPSTVP
jgi:hypothetical protein